MGIKDWNACIDKTGKLHIAIEQLKEHITCKRFFFLFLFLQHLATSRTLIVSEVVVIKGEK